MTNAVPAKRQGGNSHPIIQQQASLGSYQAQRVYDRTFKETSRSLYQISLVLKSIASEEQAAAAEKVVDDDMQKMEKSLNDEIKRLHALAEENGITSEPSFTNPLEVTLEISSQKTARYAGMIYKLDTVMGLLSLLWLTGVRTDHQYQAETYLWQRNMMKMANRIRQTAVRAIIAANKAKDDKQDAQILGAEHTEALENSTEGHEESDGQDEFTTNQDGNDDEFGPEREVA